MKRRIGVFVTVAVLLVCIVAGAYSTDIFTSKADAATVIKNQQFLLL